MIEGLKAFYNTKYYRVDSDGYIFRIKDDKLIDVFSRTQSKFKLK